MRDEYANFWMKFTRALIARSDFMRFSSPIVNSGVGRVVLLCPESTRQYIDKDSREHSCLSERKVCRGPSDLKVVQANVAIRSLHSPRRARQILSYRSTYYNYYVGICSQVKMAKK